MLNNKPLRIVNKFTYRTSLNTINNITVIQPAYAGENSSNHKSSIKNLECLSLPTAMTLFDTMISPIVTYGIDIIWEKQKLSDLEKIEKVKACFLKAALKVGKTAPLRLLYELARETLVTEDLRMKLLLPATKPYMELLHQRKLKKKEIDFDFYATGAKIERNWMKANQDL